MDTKKLLNRISAILSIAFFVFVVVSIFHGYQMKHDTEQNGKRTVGKYVSQDNWAKGEVNYFIFYINGEKHRANGGRTPGGFYENIGKFYEIIYSEKYFTVKAFYNKEVTDSLKIIKAGFSAKDIK